jgi:sugar lactone lactonase YvrE
VLCLSDGVVDAEDRLYVGDVGYNFFDLKLKPVDTCVIVCVQPDGRARVVADGLHFPNGMAITPDGRTMIVAETMGHRLTAYDVQADGIALDAEGAVWLANPEGQYGALLLGGPQRPHMFICASDSHYPAQIAHTPIVTLRVVEVAVRGQALPDA